MARETFKPRLPPEPTHVCRSDFPEGICGKPQNIIIRSLEKRAKRESLNYSTVSFTFIIVLSISHWPTCLVELIN